MEMKKAWPSLNGLSPLLSLVPGFQPVPCRVLVYDSSCYPFNQNINGNGNQKFIALVEWAVAAIAVGARFPTGTLPRSRLRGCVKSLLSRPSNHW